LRDAEEEAKAAARRAEHEAEVVRHEHFRREVWLRELLARDCMLIATECMLIATDCLPHQVWLRELLAREDSLRRENAKYV
jgi:hypothetical protein